MRLARVVGNVVSTIKDKGFDGQKLLIVDFLDEEGNMTGSQDIVFDAADAGIGDTVVVAIDGGAANILLGRHVVADHTIAGVIDSFSVDDVERKYH